MDEGLADLLHRVVQMLGAAVRRRTDDGRTDGLTYSQLRLLGTLEANEPVTQHQLARAMSISDPAVSRALKPLESAGLVRVETDPAHRRRRLVTLSEAGRAAFHAENRDLNDVLRDALVRAGFPYDRYLDDTRRLAEILERS